MQALLTGSVIANAAIGAPQSCPFGNHASVCKYGVFDDSTTGTDPTLVGLAWGTTESNTITITNDGADNVGAQLSGVWAVQRAPALHPSSDPKSTDMNGDGIDEKVVWRSAPGTWFIRFSGSGELLTEQWGLPGDIPFLGDFDGDQIPDLVVWRPSNGTWYVKTSSSLFDANHQIVQQFGLPGDVPLRGDFDGNGNLDYAVWRPGEGNWYVLKSSNHQAVVEQWGLPGDVP